MSGPARPHSEDAPGVDAHCRVRRLIEAPLRDKERTLFSLKEGILGNDLKSTSLTMGNQGFFFVARFLIFTLLFATAIVAFFSFIFSRDRGGFAGIVPNCQYHSDWVGQAG